LFRALKVGESVLAFSKKATCVSAEFCRIKGSYTQSIRLVVDPETLETRHAWLVTRVA
jgi:hypothetical protein